MACHHGIPQSKAQSDMLFLHSLACNVQYVKNTAAPSILCVIIFLFVVLFSHNLLNIVEYILYLDWPRALSKCFCSFNSVLNVGTLCAPAKPFAWNHPREISLSMVKLGKTYLWAEAFLNYMLLAYLPLCVPSQSAIPSSNAGSWRQLEIGMLRWSSILVVLVISRYWPSQSWLAELKTAASHFSMHHSLVCALCALGIAMALSHFPDCLFLLSILKKESLYDFR